MEWARDPESPHQQHAERVLRIAITQLGIQDVDRVIALATDPVPPQSAPPPPPPPVNRDWHLWPAPPEDTSPVGEDWLAFIHSFDGCHVESANGYVCPLQTELSCTHHGPFTHSFSVFNNSNPQCIGISHTNKSGTAAKGLLYFIQNTIPKRNILAPLSIVKIDLI